MEVAKTQLNVRVDETTAEAARQRALQRGMSVNRYIEELVKQDAGEVGRTFVEAASDFMKQYESVFAEEFGEFGTDTGTGSAEGTGKASGTGAGREGKR
ncbi:antitoxin [Streptomyces lunaelactis]|nr:antitoxin [Streptomyces lunaelactis]NUK07695.1 antitoxin [Streptomyces lunaelactis]NUK16213.1 antitoxin [Streptomyces lunaelactis]NUL09328.1 antitoxin [Streptomyces lunaelactis]NUL21995.1 antitoxin [Streptomyces lunaelactis]